MLICRKICFAAIYAVLAQNLFCVEKNLFRNCACGEKRTNIRYAIVVFYPIDGFEVLSWYCFNMVKSISIYLEVHIDILMTFLGLGLEAQVVGAVHQILCKLNSTLCACVICILYFCHLHSVFLSFAKCTFVCSTLLFPTSKLYPPHVCQNTFFLYTLCSTYIS